MSYVSFQDSYELEANWGVSTIPNAATQTRLLGVIREKATHPTPRFTPLYSPPAVGQREPPADGIVKGATTYQGNWTIILQNGIPLWMVMGASFTPGGGPPHTHTITPAYLPSITLQNDRKGSGTDWGIQYTGVMITRFKLLDDRRVPGLIAVIDWTAKDAADPGFVLSSTPALPATATTGPFFELVTATYDGNNLDGMTSFEFSIDPGLEALMGNWWLAGVDQQHKPLWIVEDFTRKYSLNIKMMPPNDDIWDDGINPVSASKDMVFKWQKSANDYIEITMTDCVPIFPETTTPTRKDDGTVVLEETYEFIPTQVSIEVKDAIAGGSYGE